MKLLIETGAMMVQIDKEFEAGASVFLTMVAEAFLNAKSG
jgi:Tfp pilus assembly protein PilZ